MKQLWTGESQEIKKGHALPIPETIDVGDLYDNPLDGTRCTNDGDFYPFLWKNNVIEDDEIENDELTFEKCSAFCHPYVEYTGYVGFATELLYNRCLCFFDLGFLPDEPGVDSAVQNSNGEPFTAVGPVNGAKARDGDKCYPYKVSTLIK